MAIYMTKTDLTNFKSMGFISKHELWDQQSRMPYYKEILLLIFRTQQYKTVLCFAA